VPYRGDGIRAFEDERRLMHERYLERARGSGAPWLEATGDPAARLAAARAAVDLVLAA